MPRLRRESKHRYDLTLDRLNALTVGSDCDLDADELRALWSANRDRLLVQFAGRGPMWAELVFDRGLSGAALERALGDRMDPRAIADEDDEIDGEPWRGEAK